MATRMQQRRGTAAQWTAANPTLAAGEIGFETDTNKFKIGNGSSNWAALSYFSNTAGLEALLNDGAPEALNTLNEIAAAINDDPTFFTTVGTNLTNHQNDTTDIHGIADTALLATQDYVTDAIASVEGDYSSLAGTGIDWNSDAERFDIDNTIATVANLNDHAADTTSVHGVADFELLETISGAQSKADTAVSNHNSDTTDVHGIANTANLETTSGAQTKVDTAIGTHNSDTTSVHGIDDTSALATKTYADEAVTTHSSDTTDVHGIANTANLETTSGAQTKADAAVSTHNSDTTNVHGISDTSELALTATVNSALDLKSNLESPTFTGTVTIPTLDVTTTATGITKTMVGLSNVDNTSDADKPVSTAQASAIATAKSEAIADATAQVNAVIASAPAALDTLDELAAALGDDANFATTVTNSLALKAPLASPTFTGTVTVAESGIAFTDGTQTKEGVASRTPIIQKTDSYTLSALTERDSLIEVAKASATTITIPLNSTVAYPIGTSLDILQTSTGQVTIAGAVGVTVNATPGLKLRTQWSSATLFKRAENTWVVYGDLTA